MAALKRRVVITGAGLVSPLGCSVESVWAKLIAGETGIVSLDQNYRNIQVPPGCNVNVAGLIPADEFSKNFKENSKEISLSTQYALHAASEALTIAGLTQNDTTSSGIQKTRVGVNVGSGGIGPLPDILDGHESLRTSYKKLSPYFVPKVLMNMPASQISIKYGFQGPIHSSATACASGVHSIGDAYNFIRLDYADIMVTGGTEACISPLAIAGFARMKALTPKLASEGPSRPFDSSRDGFVIGEGAGILILEELSSALRRGVPIIAEIVGYAIGGDAYHISSPAPAETGGAQRSMRKVLADAEIEAFEVGYLNAHATSTPLGDGIETDAVDFLFGKDSRSNLSPLYVSSSKGAIGHLLGAAGGVESVFTALSLQRETIPPTLNLDSPNPIPKSFKHVQKSVCYPELKYAMKNSFGFGGVNGVLLFKKFKD